MLSGMLLSVGLVIAAPRWSGPEECPGELALAEGIEAYLGPGKHAGRDEVEADARVEVVPSGYALELDLRVGERRRRHALRSPDCAELVDLAALLIASAIDPFALGGPEPIDALEPEPLAEPAIVVLAPAVAADHASRAAEPAQPRPPVQVPRSRTPRPTPELAPPSRPAVEPEPTTDPRFSELVALEDGESDRGEPPPRPRERPVSEGFFGVAGMGFAGLFPQPGGGLELDGGLDRGAFRLTGGVAGWFGGRFRDPQQPDVGGNLWAVGPMLEICGKPSLRRVEFPLCATGLGGAEIGSGVGLTNIRTEVRPWLAFGGDVGVRWRVHERVALRLGIGVLGTILRPTWETPTVTFTTPALLGRLRVAVELIPRRRSK